MQHAIRLLAILTTTYERLAAAYEKREQRHCLTEANIKELRQITTEIEKTLEMMLGDPEVVSKHGNVLQSQKRLFEEARDRFNGFLQISRGT